MKISELIIALEKELEKHGDVIVSYLHDWEEEIGSLEFFPETLFKRGSITEKVQSRIQLGPTIESCLFQRENNK